MQVQPDLPMAGPPPADEPMALGTWIGSLAAVLAVAGVLAVSFFDGPLDERVLRTARPGVASMTVADTVFDGPMVEGRSVAACSKEAIQNLTTALIDGNQFAQASAELHEVGKRCGSFR